MARESLRLAEKRRKHYDCDLALAHYGLYPGTSFYSIRLCFNLASRNEFLKVVLAGTAESHPS